MVEKKYNWFLHRPTIVKNTNELPEAAKTTPEIITVEELIEQEEAESN